MMTARRTSQLLIAAVFAAGVSLGATVAARAGASDAQPPGIDPATGGPVGAPAGCCCFPKLNPTAADGFDCKPTITEFDCKVECSQLKDGRLPSGCKWTKGECPR